MANRAITRLTREYSDLKSNPIPGVQLKVNESNLLSPWEFIFDGPKGTVYEGGKFHLITTIPIEYPFKGPTFSFSHKIYHINAKYDGTNICTQDTMDIKWKPTMKIVEWVNVIIKLFKEPEPTHAPEPELLPEFNENRKEYDRKAREWTKLYAK
ncbi:MAG: putative ubiquitin-conjugating enzyme E2-16 kDa [Streblomastix strix]|uniref:Putative ubiquitin-conjugating enzyme E2-16 kDa n=1 Tax=Streblomastix strix TaxID=222440 RepID=A0A5J4WBP9_9EUKA|nr:MAG: putative ubiquitin-conjugating enzyme E2-16 kDa [Streblomastix strix]